MNSKIEFILNMTLKTVSRVKSIEQSLIKFAKVEWIVKIDCEDILLSKTWVPQIIHVPPPPIVIPQIIFDGFTVGRFDEGNADNDFETTDASLMLSSSGAELPGCPDGFMQVRQKRRGCFELSSLLRSLKTAMKAKRRTNGKFIVPFFLFFTAKWAGTTLHGRKLVWNGWRSSTVFQWNFNGYGIC